MSLTNFYKGTNIGSKWREVGVDHVFRNNYQYAQCLAEHKNELIHLLNGGDVVERVTNNDESYTMSLIKGSANKELSGGFMSKSSAFYIAD